MGLLAIRAAQDNAAPEEEYSAGNIEELLEKTLRMPTRNRPRSLLILRRLA